MPKVYLASPLGFSPEQKPYLERVKARLHQLGYEVFDPWSLHFGEAIQEASQIANYDERVKAFTRLAKDIGEANEEGIRESDMLLAILDGAETDSGTSSEGGFAVGLGKPTYGLRTDWRDCGTSLDSRSTCRYSGSLKEAAENSFDGSKTSSSRSDLNTHNETGWLSLVNSCGATRVILKSRPLSAVKPVRVHNVVVMTRYRNIPRYPK